MPLTQCPPHPNCTQTGPENFFSLFPGDLRDCLQLGTRVACSEGNNLSNMKKTLLFIAALAATASTYAGAEYNETAPVLLPTFLVEAPRRNAAEAKIDASLAELRRAARNVVTPAAYVPALPAATRPAATEHVHAVRAAHPAFRVAKA